jgi:hypothetical protein
MGCCGKKEKEGKRDNETGLTSASIPMGGGEKSTPRYNVNFFSFFFFLLFFFSNKKNKKQKTKNKKQKTKNKKQKTKNTKQKIKKG